jgi:hypothetical protein
VDAKKARAAGDLLERNRREALALQQGAGLRDTRKLLERAQRDLQARIRNLTTRGLGAQTFTRVQLEATLRQVEAVLKQLAPGLKQVIVGGAQRAADQAAAHTADYLRRADEAFRGAGVQPLALREARMMSAAIEGSRASVLRRLASSGEPGEDGEVHSAKPGIFERYGVETIGHFERTLQKGVLARKTRAEMAEDIQRDSPFLKGAPAHWAERICRVELHAASSRAGWEAIRNADDQLSGMLKILSCVRDDRTGSDSLASHGEVRRPDEPFETWFGLSQHPPNRPNDRDVVTPHRMEWPIPPYLKPVEWGAVIARWKAEGHKDAPPARPLMSTVDLDAIGKPGKRQRREPESPDSESD